MQDTKHNWYVIIERTTKRESRLSITQNPEKAIKELTRLHHLDPYHGRAQYSLIMEYFKPETIPEIQ